MSCVACQTTEAARMVKLVPCQHLLCKECYLSPLVLVSCYGCPACGTAPSSTVEEENKKVLVDSVLVVNEEEDVSSLTNNNCDTFSAYSYYSYPSADIHSPTTTSSNNNVAIPVAPAARQVDLTWNLPTLEGAAVDSDEEADGFAHFAHPDDISVIAAAANQVDSSEDEDEGKEECGVSTDCNSSAASSQIKKRRRQKKSKKNPTHADKFATPKKPKVVVPAGCPDHLRPRTRPEPTTYREVGRRAEREFMLKKIAKGKAHSMHVVVKHCNNMTCF